MGGPVALDSAIGDGTEATVTLTPVARPAQR
jgi:hypothetical protein